MRLRFATNTVVALALTLATLASLGPHLMMAGYKLAGVRAPAALLFLCPLHQLEANSHPGLVLQAKPYRGSPH